MNLKTKRCSRCKEYKDTDAFPVDRQKSDGLYNYCRPCHAIRQRKFRKLITPEQRLKWSLKYVHGITPDEYHEYLSKPCAICGDRSEQLDHDHKTGKIRAALCQLCNRGLGQFKDNIEVLKQAVKYLENHAA